MNRKNPKYTLLNHKGVKLKKIDSSSNPKTNLQELQALSREVEQSKIAVENITSFGTHQNNFSGKLEEIQNQLQVCVTNINVESKRNKLLNELISLLKGEMFKYQATEKKKEQAEQIQTEKMKKKIEYQIDQICQKQNQEIAKIHQLKQLASSRRSQRVVYSNLFKKLQKQIKVYEESYKEQLLKCLSLKNKQKKISKQKNCEFAERIEEDDEININFNQKSHYFEASLNETFQNSNWQSYSGEKRRERCVEVEKHKKIERQGHQNTKHIKEEKYENAKNVNKKIQVFKNWIEKVKIYTECEQVGQILKHFSNIKKDNQRILADIQNQELEIDEIIQRTKQIEDKLKKISFDKQYCIVSEESKCVQNQNSNQQSSYSHTYTSMYEQLLSVCGIQNLQETLQDNLQLLQNIIQSILNRKDQKKATFLPKMQKIQKLAREDSNISDTCVNTILDRMQRFGYCQRILDRKFFQQQYLRQINKKKSSNNASKIKKYY